MSTLDTRAPQPTTRVRLGPLLQRLSLVILLLVVLLLVGVRICPLPWIFPTLPRVTHTAKGAAGDPVNVVLVGSEQQITQSFLQAG